MSTLLRGTVPPRVLLGDQRRLPRRAPKATAGCGTMQYLMMQHALTAARRARGCRNHLRGAPVAQRSALALFGFLLPCALVLADRSAMRPPGRCAHACDRGSALQIAYLRYGSPGARGWGLMAVAVPLTLAAATLAMTTDGDVLFPLLFASVCWSPSRCTAVTSSRTLRRRSLSARCRWPPARSAENGNLRGPRPDCRPPSRASGQPAAAR